MFFYKKIVQSDRRMRQKIELNCIVITLCALFVGTTLFSYTTLCTV